MSLFDQITPTDAQTRLMKLVRLDAEQLESRVNEIVDPRYRALALTELEKVVLVINKGICHGGVNEPKVRNDGS